MLIFAMRRPFKVAFVFVFFGMDILRTAPTAYRKSSALNHTSISSLPRTGCSIAEGFHLLHFPLDESYVRLFTHTLYVYMYVCIKRNGQSRTLQQRTQSMAGEFRRQLEGLDLHPY